MYYYTDIFLILFAILLIYLYSFFPAICISFLLRCIDLSFIAFYVTYSNVFHSKMPFPDCLYLFVFFYLTLIIFHPFPHRI